MGYIVVNKNGCSPINAPLARLFALSFLLCCLTLYPSVPSVCLICYRASTNLDRPYEVHLIQHISIMQYVTALFYQLSSASHCLWRLIFFGGGFLDLIWIDSSSFVNVVFLFGSIGFILKRWEITY